MFARLTIIKPWPALAFLPGLTSQYQKNPNDRPHNVPKETKPKTGYERVVAIFQLDEFGSPSKEMVTSYNTGLFSGFVGGCIGGLKEMQVKYHDFVTKMNSEMFQSHTEAKHELTKLLGATFAKSFVRWGIRLTFFTTLYTLTTNVLSSYNDAVAIWNFTASGLLTGAIYRIPLGLRAMIVAGSVGGFLGTIAGCSCVILLNVFSTKYDDIQDWHYRARAIRFEKMQEAKDELDRERTLTAVLANRTEVIKSGDLKDIK
ncbi:hypothetical protein WDU94_010290 [Cyamophila willieti]